MKNGPIKMHTAANGYCMISTERKEEYRRLSLLLMFRHGFLRWGSRVLAATGDAVYPDYVRPGLCIRAGWDNGVGYHLLAGDTGSDVFLRDFFEKYGRAPNEKLADDLFRR